MVYRFLKSEGPDPWDCTPPGMLKGSPSTTVRSCHHPPPSQAEKGSNLANFIVVMLCVFFQLTYFLKDVEADYGEREGIIKILLKTKAKKLRRFECV